MSGPFNPHNDDAICAISSPPGSGAIAVIRISGKNSLTIIQKFFFPSNPDKNISRVDGYTMHFGEIKEKNHIIDQVVAGVYRNPNSYTAEDMVEIFCHGSEYIQQKVLELMVTSGARLAQPGEFTLRAFMNGKIDLSQAEAVADLIAANSKVSHDLALNQMRGVFSEKIRQLREQLVNFSSLIELELDFSDEDVEFANRKELLELILTIQNELSYLIESFSFGNVIRKGIPVAIVGKPNVGKSTLLNTILNEERAIVSEIPGTTRDTVEDTIIINGVSFRFIDTAGLREPGDQIETIGIEKTHEKIRQARIILFLFDVNNTNCKEVKVTLEEFREFSSGIPGEQEEKYFIPVANKTDLLVESPKEFSSMVDMECIFVSAKRKENINLIIDRLSEFVSTEKVSDKTIVSNTRHYEALTKALESVERVDNGLKENLTTDLIAADLRGALHYLGEITGEITTDEILGNIFGKFCIGK